ncbi:hypothetical protein JZU54_05265, partial [bacterium]|nr:hypothetical protein [bacterium]
MPFRVRQYGKLVLIPAKQGKRATASKTPLKPMLDEIPHGDIGAACHSTPAIPRQGGFLFDSERIL